MVLLTCYWVGEFHTTREGWGEVNISTNCHRFKIFQGTVKYLNIIFSIFGRDGFLTAKISSKNSGGCMLGVDVRVLY